ncbi:class I SAM-dependent methyltransferase [Vibrio sp. SCSIO 43137]|uniref:class I SAM-dependent methyltransferase n=1 Tax=Vibrio sp. SCSIO 43137 TaxID=3021011 RepID=UPI0023079BE9|nr:class I SAM-dependent methyltransferase [Vibrio sp. SCSIO 43137]WCE28525.1 class I SAM-dependent methyltransferase [Vibrio sp. SCSIO 43137]
MKLSQLETFRSHLIQQLESAPDEIRRLFHGRGRCWEGLEQLTCDWLQGQLVVAVFKPQEDDFLQALRQSLLSLTESSIWQEKSGKTILLQHRYEAGAPTEIIWGEADNAPQVAENGLKYQLHLGRNQNFGLFLDMRFGRQWVEQRSAGKKVLNLFAYTCGFSLAAIKGGAEKVVNVDMAKASLSKGRDNHRLNDHPLEKVSFLAHDIFKSWGKIRKSGPYDLIVIDPPSFQKGSFALTKDYKKILRRLPELLTADGEVLACVNSPSVTADFLIDSMKQEAPQLSFEQRLDNPPEFRDIDDDSSLKALVFKVQ